MGQASSTEAHDVASNRGIGRFYLKHTRGGAPEARMNTLAIHRITNRRNFVYKVGGAKVQTPRTKAEDRGLKNDEDDSSCSSFRIRVFSLWS